MTTSVQVHQKYKPFWLNTFTTASLAAVANVAIYYGTAALSLFQTELVVSSLGSPIPVGLVAMASVTSILIAAGLKQLLARFTSNHQRWFLLISLLVLASSFVAPLTIPGASISMKASLSAMHIVGGVIAITRLNR
ncbi:MAG: DUF6069 family protein [Chloroflexota bacterium]